VSIGSLETLGALGKAEQVNSLPTRNRKPISDHD